MTIERERERELEGARRRSWWLSSEDSVDRDLHFGEMKAARDLSRYKFARPQTRRPVRWLRRYLRLGEQLEPRRKQALLDAVHATRDATASHAASPDASALRALVEQRMRGRSHRAPLKLVPDQHDHPLRQAFIARLVEDKTTQAMSYVDFLCSIHRKIQSRMAQL